jgi:hypothetical protein
MEIRATGYIDIQTVELHTSGSVRQLALDDNSLGIQSVIVHASESPLDFRMEGLRLRTFEAHDQDDLSLTFVASEVQSMTSEGKMSLNGTGRVSNLAVSGDNFHVILREVPVSNVSVRSPGNLHIATTIDTMATEDPLAIGGGGSIGNITVNERFGNSRMNYDIAGVNIQLFTTNAESVVNSTGSSQINTFVANASTHLRGNKVNLLVVNSDNVTYQSEPDRINTAAGVRPPQTSAQNPNMDISLPSSQQGGNLDVSGELFATVCGHPRDAGGFTRGDGSVDNPFVITTAMELAHITMHPSSHYVQGANIDVADDSRFVSGFDMICGAGIPFSGSFDGAGYTIANLRINSAADHVGLFAENIGTIQNVSIISGEITSTAQTRANVGGIVGFNYGGGRVTASRNGARISARSLSYVGGIAGYNFGGRITDSFNTARVTGGAYTGGLVGVNWEGATLAGSYNVGIVEGENFTGAVAGVNDNSAVTNCFYLVGTAEEGIGVGAGTAASRTAEQFSSAQMVTDLAAGSENSLWASGNSAYPYPVLRVT